MASSASKEFKEEISWAKNPNLLIKEIENILRIGRNMIKKVDG